MSATQIALEQEMKRQGCPITAENNAAFEAACRFLDAAAIADDPALLAARDDLQRKAFDPAHPVGEAFRMALLNSIQALVARVETEQRVKDLASQALSSAPSQSSSDMVTSNGGDFMVGSGHAERVADKREEGKGTGGGRGAAA